MHVLFTGPTYIPRTVKETGATSGAAFGLSRSDGYHRRDFTVVLITLRLDVSDVPVTKSEVIAGAD